LLPNSLKVLRCVVSNNSLKVLRCVVSKNRLFELVAHDVGSSLKLGALMLGDGNFQVDGSHGGSHSHRGSLKE